MPICHLVMLLPSSQHRLCGPRWWQRHLRITACTTIRGTRGVVALWWDSPPAATPCHGASRWPPATPAFAPLAIHWRPRGTEFRSFGQTVGVGVAFNIFTGFFHIFAVQTTYVAEHQQCKAPCTLDLRHPSNVGALY